MIPPGVKAFWTAALAVAGLGAIGAFIFYGLYNKFLDLPVFRQLTSGQTFALLVLFLGLTFLALVAILWTYIISKRSHRPVADTTALHQLEHAWGDVHHINRERPVGPHCKNNGNALTLLQTYWRRDLLPRDILIEHYLDSVRDLVNEMRDSETLVPGYESLGKRVKDFLPPGLEATLAEMETYATRTRNNTPAGNQDT